MSIIINPKETDIKKIVNNVNKFEVDFIKKNGEKRHMIATRKFDYTPITNRGSSPEVCVVYDLEKDGIRCFKYSAVQRIIY